MPKDLLYYVTIYSPPNERVQTIARDPDGTQRFDNRGLPFHEVVTFDIYCSREGRRLEQKLGVKTKIDRREDGEIALYVVKQS